MRKKLPTNFLPVLKIARKALLPVMAIFLSSALFGQVSYTTDVTSGCNNLTVKFTNTSTVGNAYKWNFGDGTNSVGKNVTHTYTSTGNYNAYLTAFDSTGPTTFTPKGSSNPGSVISVNGSNIYVSTSQACVGEMITAYLNPSANSANWDFGDGSAIVPNSPNGVSHSYSVAGTYSVKVTGTASCGSFTAISKVIVSNTAVPTVTYYNGLSGNASICPGQSLTYNSNNNFGKSYLWNFGDGTPTSNVVSPSHSFATVGKYVVSLTMTNICGQSNTYKDTTRVASIGYFPKNMQIMKSVSQACPNDLINFNANFNAKAQVWKFGNGDSSTQSNPNYGYKVAGTYTVTVHLYNACGKDTLLSTSVTVGSNYNWSGNPVINVNSGPAIYPNSNINLYPSVSATKYIWNFGDGSPLSTLTTQNTNHSYNNSGTYAVSVVITNGCGKDTTLKTSINVVPNPIGFTVDVMNGCAPLKVTFTNTSSKGNYYQWNFGDGGSSSVKSPVYTYTRQGQYNNIQLNVYDTTGGKMAYLGNAYLNGNIQVNGGNISSSTDTACVSEQVNFNIYPNANSATWDFGDGTPVSTQLNASHAYAAVGTYVVTGTAAVGSCPSAAMTKKIVVSSTAKPSAYFFFSKTSCPNEQVNFNPQNYKAASYSWNFGDGSPSSNASNAQHLYTKLGNYAVTLTVTNACGNSGFYRDTVRIVSNLIVPANISINSSSSMACPGDNISFSYNNYMAASQVWRFGNGDSSMVPSPNYAYSKVGTYTVSLILTNGCGNSATFTKIITIGGALWSWCHDAN
jgi:PKD repeat protein